MLKYSSLLLLLLLSNLQFALGQVHVPDAVEDETAKNSPSSEILEVFAVLMRSYVLLTYYH
jgi:hypothetical protein